MKHIAYRFFVLLCVVVLISSCGKSRKRIDTSGNITPEVKKTVIIYGSENCDHCLEFRKAMDESKLKYTFKDAEASEAVYQELLLKIQQANFKGYVAFPVLDVDGSIFVKPDFLEIKKLLSN